MENKENRGGKKLPANIKKSDAYKRNETHDPTTPDQVTSSDAYERNKTHDPKADGHVQSSDAYERNVDQGLAAQAGKIKRPKK